MATTSQIASSQSLGERLVYSPSTSIPSFELTSSNADSVCTPYQAPASPTTPYFSDEEIVKRFLPQFGYQLYFKSPDSASEMDEVVDQFLQPMHSPNYRRGYQSEKRPDGEMGNWVKEGRLQASILKLREARRAGNLPEPPLEPVSYLRSLNLKA